MQAINQVLNQVSNKKLLAVFPHPDDETVMGAGLLQRAKKLGFEVKVLCLTKGDVGQCYIDKSDKSLADIRTQEMAQAMKILGVEYQLLSYKDASLKDSTEWPDAITRALDTFDPGIVFSYDHSGISGHPDHISVSREVFAQLQRRPETILLWPSFKGLPKKKMLNSAVAKHFQEASLELKLSPRESLNKYFAIKAHKSQGLGRGLPLPLWVLSCLYRCEYFAQADLNKNYTYQYVDFAI